jgi:hypothetical protein
MAFYDLLARLDDSAFLGLKVWEFSLRSLQMRHGLTFLGRVVLSHPVSTWVGMLKHRRIMREHPAQGETTFLFEGPEEDFAPRLLEAKTHLLVAMGYCQKPLAPECPVGRPNHDCLFLDRLDLDRERKGHHPACEVCHIRTVGTQALRAGASMNIMTSALDIARDVMIPAVGPRRFHSVIMGICPYSVRVITLPLAMCGLEGYLFGYASGNCVTWEQWLRADEGIKFEQTTLSADADTKLMTLLEGIAEQRAREGQRYVRFERQANIYVPVT